MINCLLELPTNSVHFAYDQAVRSETRMFEIFLIDTYLLGAIPWSVWLGKGLFGLDPRHQADTNPGAANAFRAGGWRLGVLVLVLDYLKAFIPVFIANYGLSFSDEQRFWIALM